MTIVGCQPLRVRFALPALCDLAGGGRPPPAKSWAGRQRGCPPRKSWRRESCSRDWTSTVASAAPCDRCPGEPVPSSAGCWDWTPRRGSCRRSAPRGLDRLRHPLRRFLEVVANARRAGPWADAVVAAAPGTDVFHAQSLIVLPVVRDAARRLGGRFVYDVADYHTEAARLARMPWLVRELVRRRERDWARDASALLAVSDPVADLVVRRWGVPRPTVLWNCPPAWRPDHPGPVASDRIRAATGIEPERPIVLYQGGFSVDRGVEELVAAATEPRLMELGAAVVFMGYGRLETFIADAVAAHPGRVYLLPAVRPDALMSWTASADVGFVGQPPRTLNQKMNLPNKLFESIMAGVPVVVSEGNEQCRLTREEGIGVCVDIDDPAAIAAACARLLAAPIDERTALRSHCRAVALEKYTWDQHRRGPRGAVSQAGPGERRRSARGAPRRFAAPGDGLVSHGVPTSHGTPTNHGVPRALLSLSLAVVMAAAGFGGAAASDRTAASGAHDTSAVLTAFTAAANSGTTTTSSSDTAGASGDRTLVTSAQLRRRPFRGMVLIAVGERVVCTGFVVSPSKVVTAAHCLTRDAARGDFRLRRTCPAPSSCTGDSARSLAARPSPPAMSPRPGRIHSS